MTTDGLQGISGLHVLCELKLVQMKTKERAEPGTANHHRTQSSLSPELPDPGASGPEYQSSYCFIEAVQQVHAMVVKASSSVHTEALDTLSPFGIVIVM